MELKKILMGLEGLKVKGDLSIDIKKILCLLQLKVLKQMVMNIF